MIQIPSSCSSKYKKLIFGQIVIKSFHIQQKNNHNSFVVHVLNPVTWLHRQDRLTHKLTFFSQDIFLLWSKSHKTFPHLTSFVTVAPAFSFHDEISELEGGCFVLLRASLVSGCFLWTLPWPRQSGRSSRWSVSLHRPSRPSRSHSPSLKSGHQLEGPTHTGRFRGNTDRQKRTSIMKRLTKINWVIGLIPRHVT